MKNIHLIKLGGMMALVCFLFMPVAGCGGMTISGVDLMKTGGYDNSVKVFSGLAMLCAVLMIFVPDKIVTSICSIGGLISLVIAFLIVKGKMSSGNDFGISNSIEIKSGAYLSMVGFIVSSIASLSKNEFFDNQTTNLSNQTTNNDILKFRNNNNTLKKNELG